MPRRHEQELSRRRAGAKRSAESRGCEDGEISAQPKSRKKLVSTSPACAKETRLVPFITKPNSAVRERVARAFSRRLHLIDKKLSGNPPSDCEFFIVGATGNVYTVNLSLLPSCTCRDHAKGNTCKHILFVMLRVLKLPFGDPRIWQKALLPSELHNLIENSSVNDAVLASSLVRRRSKEITGKSSTLAVEPLKSHQREIDGDCPICYKSMASSDGKPSETVVFCKTCGNNVHADCFKKWSKRKKKGRVTCIYCRAVWENDAKGAGGDYNRMR